MKKNSKKLPYSIYNPSEIETNKLVDCIARFEVNKLIYRKINDIYEVYCPNCKNVKKMTWSEFKIYRNIKLCDNCYNQYRETSRVIDRKIVKYAAIKKDEFIYGYEVSFVCEFDEYINIKIELVYVRNLNEHKFCKLGIKFNSGGCLHRGLSDTWKEGRLGYTGLRNYEDEFYFEENLNKLTKKEYLNNFSKEVSLKSNQLYLVKKNHVNDCMLYAIEIFNLNYYDDVINNIKYIQTNIRRKQNFNYNLFVLEYLSKNNIRIDDYHDYLEECKYLNINDKYPKNFYETHAKISEKVNKIKEDELRKINEVLIKNRAIQLKKFEYIQDKYELNAIKDYDELINTGRVLKNCIYSYKEKYAKANCDLFIVKEDGNIKCSIEVIGKKVIQARINLNKDPNGDLKKFIKNWCKKNDLTYVNS